MRVKGPGETSCNLRKSKTTNAGEAVLQPVTSRSRFTGSSELTPRTLSRRTLRRAPENRDQAKGDLVRADLEIAFAHDVEADASR